LQQARIVKPSRDGEQIEKFEYLVMPFIPIAPSVIGLEEISSADESCETGNHEVGFVHRACVVDAEMLTEARGLAFAAGREQGVLDGRHLEREVHVAEDKFFEDQRKQQIARLIDQFAKERDRYLHTVEKEVVKLALAVAARILRREAQMDPLLLTGAVRVALGQLSGSTEARVSVPPAELDLWKDALTLLPNLAIKPQVLPGDGMLLGDCVIETALGSVDLGIRSQLGEIERGFFDSAPRSKAPLAGAESRQETAGSRA
jgi:flagellar biosynthesis/type III secretory pathway protein FliH